MDQYKGIHRTAGINIFVQSQQRHVASQTKAKLTNNNSINNYGTRSSKKFHDTIRLKKAKNQIKSCLSEVSTLLSLGARAKKDR